LKEILKVHKDNDDITFDIDAQPIDLLGVVMQLITIVADETGVDYNDLLEDLKEIK